ncbi:MAG: hypothetical protein WA705_06460 [Candidatus Ozemobacteraceae bacterium]
MNKKLHMQLPCAEATKGTLLSVPILLPDSSYLLSSPAEGAGAGRLSPAIGVTGLKAANCLDESMRGIHPSELFPELAAEDLLSLPFADCSSCRLVRHEGPGTSAGWRLLSY